MYDKIVEYNEKETVTMLFERYESMKEKINELNSISIELNMLKDGNISKKRAEEILNSLRITYGFYIGEDPNKVKINMEDNYERK